MYANLKAFITEIEKRKAKKHISLKKSQNRNQTKTPYGHACLFNIGNSHEAIPQRLLLKVN